MMFPVPGWFWRFPAYNCFRDLMKLPKYFHGSMCTFRAILNQNMTTCPQENSTIMRKLFPLKSFKSYGTFTKDVPRDDKSTHPKWDFENQKWKRIIFRNLFIILQRSYILGRGTLAGMNALSKTSGSRLHYDLSLILKVLEYLVKMQWKFWADVKLYSQVILKYCDLIQTQKSFSFFSRR